LEIRGKAALVTGSAVRVGRSIALALARAGAHVVVHYLRSKAQAEETAEGVRAFGVEALTVQGDISKAKEVEALVQAAEARFSSIDILVNNASIYYRKAFEELTEEDWDRNLEVNLKGAFLLSHRLGPSMKRRGSGKIVNIADWAGYRPYVDYLPYCVSKAGLIALTQGLALALAPEVQVNAVAPGPVLPPQDFTPEERRAIERAVPLRRIGSPEDVARAVLFLIEGGDFITGAVLPVDGGRLIA
jgi:NAD(P)-dependent dehydrogenase (short-subunit alcohol dehydrogenase family)